MVEVIKSLSGKKWVMKSFDEREAATLTQKLGVSEVLSRLLATRGVTHETAERFLNPSFKDSMPDPLSLKDMKEATARIVEALEKKEVIAVFGDYDVDGATSSAILKKYLKSFGSYPLVYIPDRLKEGYGPNVQAFEKLKEQGAKVVITVDCGTTAFEALEHAKKIGLDVIVLDHHGAEERLPEAVAIVNPNRRDEKSELKNLAAVGLVFLFIVSLNRALREKGWFKALPEPDIKKYLDLVALGTVCDVVSLTGLNRAYVRHGLNIMSQRENLGLRALENVARITERPNTYHAGFLWGPRINAGGRVGQADLGVRLLSSNSETEVADLAQQLDGYNKTRQEIEQSVLEEALAQINDVKDYDVLIASGEGWHPGVIGIVAGRLKEKYSLPSLVVAFEEGIGKGSGRSVAGVDLGSAIQEAVRQDLLIAGGGHPMAAGFTVAQEKFEAFSCFIKEKLIEGLQSINYQPVLQIDSALSLSAATIEFLEEVGKLGPFGMGNPSPKFMFSHVRSSFSDVVGKDHVRCTLVDESGAKLPAISFKSKDLPMGDKLLSREGKPFHVVGGLKVETWQGRQKIKLFIEDVAEV